LDPEALIVDNDVIYPHFSWSIQPLLAGTLQHPEKFYFWQLQALARGILTFKKGFHLQNSYTVNILNNYEEGSIIIGLMGSCITFAKIEENI
jgi:hypothetical protein